MVARVRIHYVLTGVVIIAFVLSFLAFAQNISSSVKALVVDPSRGPSHG